VWHLLCAVVILLTTEGHVP